MTVVVNAYNFPLNERLARQALLGLDEKPSVVAMHPLQLLVAIDLYKLVGIEWTTVTKFEDLEVVKRMAEGYTPSTFMGATILQDPTMSKSEIHFRDPYGKVLSKIVNLSIPVT